MKKTKKQHLSNINAFIVALTKNIRQDDVIADYIHEYIVQRDVLKSCHFLASLCKSS